ncbi:flippase-like domain-containing protein [Mucilaginibacter rubeus]|uniref:Flippase-like domain-containing protein n=1 Tax=Mucilaginibacter rubeus TaxID=2027860 RepID=A0AAE6JAV1_9SPHI|nr:MULTISPECIES: lysylphosphatidylglycerol synthase transmembrane domain-containing protein [Mucilaginibacter]QEM02113.1 flippase-like domain-containing protein [Mucilaginibacter rubeus]QEM14741.1 flippase-like domain-containing protein [Mucilaginibacter gossypii]QTE42552.1 flippase-like domain-containing protein [Mucilaginibacter rubeus]QTE49153.1 flippase-like domain-containing protein [Mucilaginibacter rubeus]QTE54251.1 flippase-like domain-containing protein [Mucilaginibacter rubeus]
MTQTEDIIDEGAEHKTWKGKLWGVIKVILIIAVTGGLLYYVFSKVPFAKIKYRLIHADRAWLAAAIACYIGSMFFSSWRLLSYFKSIGLRLDWRFNLRLYFLGLCYNVLLPGGIGGDGYKIYLLHKRYHLPTKKVFWAILFDRLSGFWAIGAIVVGLVILIPSFPYHLAWPLGIVSVGSVIYYAVARKFFKEYTYNFIQAHLKAIGVQSMQLLAIVCLLLAQDFNGKFAPYLLSFLFSSLAAIIPFSLGGGGVRDALFLTLARQFNLAEDMAVYLSLGFYLISIIVALLGVYYVLAPKRLDAGLKKGEEPKLENHPIGE